MFVGESGVQRIVQRSADLMRESGRDDIHALGGIELALLQKYINLWYSESLDLFGGEDSSNAASYFAAGLKGRYRESGNLYDDHRALDGVYMLTRPDGSTLEIPMRRAMNAVLRDAYIQDCERGLARWNRELERREISARLHLPAVCFNRQVGAFAATPCGPAGRLITADECARRQSEWFPTEDDRARVAELLQPVHQRGKVAGWIAPPARGINNQPFDFEYVRLG
jgi:benzoyl-CoA 2,3-dioxygenase component B